LGKCVFWDEHIRQVLAKAETFEEAAKTLRIEPSTLWRKRRRMGI
jgi:two-component system, NtrC family, response regulator AlgB